MSRSIHKKEWRKIRQCIDELYEEISKKENKPVNIAEIKGLQYKLSSLEADNEFLMQSINELESSFQELEDKLCQQQF